MQCVWLVTWVVGLERCSCRDLGAEYESCVIREPKLTDAWADVAAVLSGL